MKFNEMPYKRIDADAVRAEYAGLTDAVRSAASVQDVTAALARHEKLLSHYITMSQIAYIHNSINTRDEYWEAENSFYDEKGPLIEEATHAFSLALLGSSHRPELEKKFGALMFTNMEMETKAFSPEIVPDLQRENALISEYQKLTSSARIMFDGRERNIAEISAYYENPSREIRKSACLAVGGFYESIKPELDRIFGELVACRDTIAHKLGYDNFVPVGYLRRTRNCYNEDMIKEFRRQIVHDIVPVVSRLKKLQSERTGIADMKFWDDVFMFREGNPKPLGSADDILEKGRRMYREMSPETAEFIDFMYDGELLDVQSKDGKAPGGYSTELPDFGATFIFSNFNSTSGDVDVLTHEAGHSYAAYRVRDFELLEQQSPSNESCEVHSMSMEFMCWPWHDLFYGNDSARSRFSHLSDAMIFLPYGTMVDHFQHIVYEQPELTPAQRDEEWLKLEKIYRPYLDFGDLPFYSAGGGWQRQLHIYHYPFYYIDYCLAQSVAFEFWALSRRDRDDAWKRYNAFVAQGGKQTFTQLCATAGVKTPFEPGVLSEIAKSVTDYLDAYTENGGNN